MTGKNRGKRAISFLLLLCLLVPMFPRSIGMDAKADDATDTVTTTLHDLYIDRYVTADNSDILKNNSFYTISVDEVDKSKFSDTVTLPDTKILSGGDKTVELPSKDKDGNAVTWYTEKGGDVTTISKKDENTVTVTVKGINEQVLLTTDKSKAEGLKVHCFVLIDQQPEEVGLLTTTKTQSNTSWGTEKNYTRYYITSAQAETVYKKYGFDASQYAPNTTDAQKYNFAIGFYNNDLTISDNSARMWADIVPINVDGEYKIPMISEEDGKKYGSCSVYYIPNNTEKKDFWTKDITIDKNSFTTSTDFLKSNSFYTVSAQDDAGKFGSDTAMPEKQCILNGKSVTMTLPYKEGVKWYANGIQVKPEHINDNKADYTVTVNQKTTFTTKVSLMPINAYVVIDDKWTPVEKEWTWDSTANEFKDGKLTISEDQTTGTGNNERYYITETQLKQIFAAYDPSIKVENTNHFAHEMIVKSNPDTVWADTTVFTVGSEKCIPLNMLTSGKGAAIYYTPKDSGKLSNTDALRKNNCLKYSISANNKKGYLYVDKNAALPEKEFFDTGATTNVSITLPNFSDSAIQWVAKDTNGKDCTNHFAQTSNKNNTTTYTLNQTDGIRQQYIFEPKNANQKLRVVYNTDVSKSLEDIFSKNSQKDYQEVVQPCSIKGDITYTTSEIQKNASYTVLRPDDDYAVVNHTKYSKQYYYTFDCWEVTTVGGGKKTIQAGAVLDYATLQEYANADAEVQLQAKWKLRDKKGRPDSVNFFVGLGCEILDYGGNTKSQPKENFTKDSVYSTRIHGTDHVIGHALMDENNKYQSGIYIADAANANTAFDLDEDLRNAANNIPLYVTSDKTATQSIYCPLDEGVDKAEITVDSMPTDEEIFRKIRNSKEEVYKSDPNNPDNKVIIPKENLTTDKYAIRWYVLKYQNSDGWHIDGVLVEKNAKVIIKKTFVGDSEAIDDVKKNYSITITKSDDTSDKRTLTLKEASSSDSTSLGYTTYDKTTETYTWVVEGYQGEQYTVKEQNYTAPDITSEENSRAGTLKKAFTSTSRYSIHNAENHEHDTNGDKPYTDDGVSVTMAAYATDIDNQYYQTVHLTNIYVQAGILTLSKADRVTGHGLGNVQFKLSNQNGLPLELLRRPNTNQYSVKTQQAGKLDYTEPVPDNIVQTDANGYVQLRLPPLIDGDTVDTRYDGKYYLEEILPEGYTGAKKISITVTDQGGVRFTIVALDDNDNDTTSTWLDNTQNDAPILYNTSKMLTTVTAVKKWTATTLDDSKVPVTVQLCRNGRPLENVSDKVYTQTLNAANHWQYTWENLPLYIDGEIAKYSLRELSIGDTKYDADVINDYDTDGYEEYEVTEDATKYYEGEDSPIQSDNTVDESKFKHTLAAWKDNSGKMHYSNHALLVIRNAPVSADISFEKVDAEHGRALANAEFTLYSDEQCTQKVTGEGFQNPEVSNYEFGTVQFNKLPAGTYYFKETKAPPGYEADDTIYKAVIRNGKTDITPMSKGREEESKQSNGVTVTNVSKMKLTIKKFDMDGNLITSSPATFKIQDGTDSTKIQQTNNGEITLTNVAEGEQYIFEVSAPEGYKTLDTHVTLEIANGEIKSIEENPDEDHWVLQRDDDCSYTLMVKNEPLVSLPSAGGRGYPLALLLGAGLMCGASGLALWLRRRKNQ